MWKRFVIWAYNMYSFFRDFIIGFEKCLLPPLVFSLSIVAVSFSLFSFYSELLPLEKDTLILTSTIFGLLYAFASLCFSWVRALSSDEFKEDILIAGERYLSSALFFLNFIAIKYAISHYIPFEYKILINQIWLLFGSLLYLLILINCLIATYKIFEVLKEKIKVHS